MKRSLIITLACLWAILVGCATQPVAPRVPTCVPTSVMCAMAYSSKPVNTRSPRLTLGPAYNVRIALGHTVNPRINHVQAQVQVDRVWHWLQFDGRWCFIGERDPQFAGEIYETVSIGEAIELLNK